MNISVYFLLKRVSALCAIVLIANAFYEQLHFKYKVFKSSIRALNQKRFSFTESQIQMRYVMNLVLNRLLMVFLFTPGIVVAGHIEQVSGWAEKVALGSNPPIILRAKIDTGAKNSSIHTVEHHIFKKDGKEWVSFAIINKEGDRKRIEEPLLRYTQIKQKSGRPSRQRPVILLGICMGNVYKKVEVNLVDRTNFNFPMLIGRSFLQGSFVVDADHRYINKPNCNQ